jgi:DNA-binding transcriptional ArsR family regulator
MKNKDLERSVEGAQKIVKVLNDRTRLKILFFFCRNKKRNVSELQSLVQRSHTATSHHLSTLKSNRMVSAERKGKYMYYSLNDEHIKTILKVLFEHTMEEGEFCGTPSQKRLL